MQDNTCDFFRFKIYSFWKYKYFFKENRSMQIIGLIAEYNPLHNGHIYQINKIRELYPDSLIILCLGSCFTQRGDISLLTKEDKVKMSLEYGIDIVIELPIIYTVQSADIFAYQSIKILNNFKINTLVFGSESNNIRLLKELAIKQDDLKYQEKVKEYLNNGFNYPSALAKALEVDFEFNANDLLGISYLKAINKTNPNIRAVTIKRTNNYLDTQSNDIIVSASNIRKRFFDNEDVSKFTPCNKLMVKPNYALYFKMLKLKIMTSRDLDSYLDVSEGLDNLLKKVIMNCYSLEELILKIKTKRYTYNRLNRMFLHIVLGIKKDYQDEVYLRILGFNKKGQEYIKLNNIKENYKNTDCYNLELKGSCLYDMLTNKNTYQDEVKNTPIIKEDLSN